MGSTVPRLLVPFIHSMLLIAGLGICGWWLAAFEAPAILCVLVFLALIYLIWVGQGGIVPVSAAVSMLLALVVALDSFPDFWPEDRHYRHWAAAMLRLWIVCMATVYLLGSQSQSFQGGAPRSRWLGQFVMLAIGVVGLKLGALTYQLGLFS